LLQGWAIKRKKNFGRKAERVRRYQEGKHYNWRKWGKRKKRPRSPLLKEKTWVEGKKIRKAVSGEREGLIREEYSRTGPGHCKEKKPRVC